MSDTRKLKDVIQKVAGTDGTEKTYPVLCTVLDVSLPARTCTCSAVNDKDVYSIENVLLMACVDDGLLLVPTIGSNVVINTNARALPFVELFSELDDVMLVAAVQIQISAPAIQFNDGSFGGVVKGDEFLTQENKTVQLLQALLDVINGTVIDEPGNGAPSALQVALKAAVTGLDVPDFSDSVNTIITHGQ